MCLCIQIYQIHSAHNQINQPIAIIKAIKWASRFFIGVHLTRKIQAINQNEKDKIKHQRAIRLQMLNIILNDWFPIVKSLIINQIHQHNIQMQHNKTPHTNILRIHFINLHVFFQIRLIQSHKRVAILFHFSEAHMIAFSLSVTNLIKNITRYNQNQKE